MEYAQWGKTAASRPAETGRAPSFVGGAAREQEVDVDREALAVAVRAVLGLPY